MSQSWMKKHAKNLLSTMPVDDKASALHSHGPVDPKTGKKTHPQLDPKLFNKRTNTEGPDTSIPEDEAAKLKTKHAIKAAKNKAERFAKTAAGRREARNKANKAPRSKIKLNKE